MATKTSKTLKKAASKEAVKIKVSYPAKYTAQAIVKYIAEKHAVPRAKAQEIIDDVFDVINAGVIKGQRVPVGKFGKLFIKVKPATKERLGRNPLTGEEITIPAKKATKVPKFTFSKSYKEIALKATIK
ncbi:MAG TPA: HU family DNA-binding protein [Spirochaetota bacterium]|nr:HU family DNA-binding protein [Spirochaetota bacterium]HPC43333.1 HU family DNA-binding protein [Spirochaetota bacterium]HPL17509.1 HU family DNA-binding protein [Spirochaetota bacterium]HQF06946.1 HU family DNA-binding protein [Spirochaetota bacterium]HQH95683.1 HU family DNA-binding protein [Spirochaetota bacterium]